MINEKIYIYENNKDVYLDVFLCNDSPEYFTTTRPFMLICPGGGYRYCSAREAEPIVRAFMADGYNAAVLYYSVKSLTEELYDIEKEYSKPHYEVAKSICIIRDNAERWNVNPDQIAVSGFSAGGHLAACSGILWNDKNVVKALGCKEGYNKPNAVVLGYPVITSGEKAHKGSFDNLLGSYSTPERLEYYSLEKRVTSDTPPIFMAHTSVDESVPVHSSTFLATALADNKIPFELHVFPYGPHGMSIATREVRQKVSTAEIAKYNTRWLGFSMMWLERIFNL